MGLGSILLGAGRAATLFDELLVEMSQAAKFLRALSLMGDGSVEISEQDQTKMLNDSVEIAMVKLQKLRHAIEKEIQHLMQGSA